MINTETNETLRALPTVANRLAQLDNRLEASIGTLTDINGRIFGLTPPSAETVGPCSGSGDLSDLHFKIDIMLCNVEKLEELVTTLSSL